MSKENTCKDCNKQFSSKTKLNIHKREKHTFNNVLEKECIGCNKIFNAILYSKQKNIFYQSCEECRDLSKKLKTRTICNKTFVYGLNNERYYIDNGNPVKVCSVYNCNNPFSCEEHSNKEIVKCRGTKCVNCYVKNNFNFCNNCREKDTKSKDKLRQKLKEFKLELGGKCIDCGFNKLFYLEFDHIDSTKKTIQITRSSPNKWENEKSNLEIRCGRCHRIKTYNDRNCYEVSAKNETARKIKKDKKEFVKTIKKEIGKCQVCNWEIDNKDEMCCVLDFDHICGKKYKQISNLYNNSRENIAEEIKKTRLLCRHCHELNTCLQKGGVCLQFYFTEEEIEELKKKLLNEEKNKEYQKEIERVVNKTLEE